MDESNRPSNRVSASLRASDADRERLTSLLQESYTEGRLTYEELQDRLERTYNSKTLGELEALRADLPIRSGPQSSSPAGRWANANRVRDRILTYVLIMLFLVAIWAASGRHGSFWPIWPIVIGGFILAMDVLGLRRPGRRGRRLTRHLSDPPSRERRRGD